MSDARLRGAPVFVVGAMKLGVNYPCGPFEWLDGWSVGGVIAMLNALDRRYRGERYRTSPWLEREIP